MNSYQISELEQLSGIKAHTIRIWEKRYNLFSPDRTATNIRYYSNEDLVKLLNISTLINVGGYKISKIASLHAQDLTKLVKDLTVNENAQETYINALLQYTLSFDQQSFSNTFDELIEKFTPYDIVTQIVYPFLYKIGIMWSTAETTPIEEHFASTLIRKKLILLNEKIKVLTNRPEKVFIFLPDDEWHEIALIFTENILKTMNIEPYNFGQNVPTENLISTINQLEPSHLITFFISRKTEKELHQIIENLLNSTTKSILIIGGNPENLKLIPKNERIIFTNKPSDLKEIFK
ncbi:MAG: MerR family transcriptional regulator [Cytophagales bacterium]